MRICPKCLCVYGSSLDQFCKSDGSKTFDAIDIEAKALVRKLKLKNKKEDGLHPTSTTIL